MQNTQAINVKAGNATAIGSVTVSDNMPGIPCPDPAGYKYVGARYVPLFADPAEWNINNTYEPLTIVLNEGNSYTSKQFVPVGIQIDNEEYWALTGNYNAQVELYRQEVKELAKNVALLQSRGVRVSELGYNDGDNIDAVFETYNGKTPYIDIDILSAKLTKTVALNPNTLITSSNPLVNFNSDRCNIVWQGPVEAAVFAPYATGNGLDAENTGTHTNLSISNIYINGNNNKVGFNLCGVTESTSIENIGVINCQYGIVLGHNWYCDFGRMTANNCANGIYGNNNDIVSNVGGGNNINSCNFSSLSCAYNTISINLKNQGTGNSISTICIEHYTDTGLIIENGQYAISSIYTETGSVIEGTENFNYDINIKNTRAGKATTIGTVNVWKTKLSGNVLIMNMSADPANYRPLLTPDTYVGDMEIGGPIIINSNFTTNKKLSGMPYNTCASTTPFYLDRSAFTNYFEIKKNEIIGFQIYVITAPNSDETITIDSTSITIPSGKASYYVYEDITTASSAHLYKIEKAENSNGGYYILNVIKNAVPTYNYNQV